jgi:oligoribonuclease NrnB/cAMP/cGMP phosphodiesterase (DHH superfamily)
MDVFGNPPKTCGTELFYEHLQQKGYISGSSKILREFVNFVRDYDTWAWKTFANGQPIKQFNDLLYILGRDEFIERCLKRYKGNRHIVEFSKDEQKLLDKRQAEIDAYVEKKMGQAVVRATIIGTGDYYKYAVVFADRFISELGNRLCEANKDIIDCAMIIDMGARKISYRSVKPDVDVSKLAAYFGGGGHKAAAGNYFNEHALMSAISHLEYGMYNPTEGLVKAMTADTDEQIEKPKKRFKLFGRK